MIGASAEVLDISAVTIPQESPPNPNRMISQRIDINGIRTNVAATKTKTPLTELTAAFRSLRVQLIAEVTISDIKIKVIAKPSFPFNAVAETINNVLKAVKIIPKTSGNKFFKVGRQGFCGETAKVLTRSTLPCGSVDHCVSDEVNCQGN